MHTRECRCRAGAMLTPYGPSLRDYFRTADVIGYDKKRGSILLSSHTAGEDDRTDAANVCPPNSSIHGPQGGIVPYNGHIGFSMCFTSLLAHPRAIVNTATSNSMGLISIGMVPINLSIPDPLQHRHESTLDCAERFFQKRHIPCACFFSTFVRGDLPQKLSI